MKHVYVIWWKEEYACKIGISSAPKTRLERTARTWNPYVVLEYYSPLVVDARAVEVQAHEQLKKAGKHWFREWFRVHKDEARELIDKLSQFHSKYYNKNISITAREFNRLQKEKGRI